MNTRGDAIAPELLVQVERLAQRPPMLERMKAAGRVQRALGSPIAECRNRFAHSVPRAAPDQPRAARPEDPLVRAADEEVAAQVGDSDVLDAEAVHPVDAQQDAFGVAS